MSAPVVSNQSETQAIDNEHEKIQAVLETNPPFTPISAIWALVLSGIVVLATALTLAGMLALAAAMASAAATV